MIENKSRLSQTLEKAANVFIIIMPVFSVGYFLWMRYSIPLVFYVSNYRDISTVGVFILIIGYISTIGLLIYTKGHHKSKIRMMGIVIFIITVPLCCLNNAVFLSLPTVLDKVEISNTTYYLTGEPELLDAHVFHHLYKCNNSSFQCEKTSFWMGGGGSFQPIKLMIDKMGNPDEVNVIRVPTEKVSWLEYTYGEQPRYYDYPALLNDHLYYLAYYRHIDNKSDTYLLYECESDNTYCEQLPIMYEGFGYLRETVADETTGEISVYIDNRMDQETLIFKWGEKPQCFVEGCEILDTQN